MQVGFLALSHLLLVLELVAGEPMHAVVLVVEDVGGDIVVDELDDEVYWVL